MPETSQATIITEVGTHQAKVLKLLNSSDLIPIEDIQDTLQITRPQALTILQQMEAAQKIQVSRSSNQLFIKLK